MLQLSHIQKEYPTPRGTLRILTDITFDLDAGEAVAITGPSGTGKSSLLYIVGGLEAPTAGTVRLGEADLYALAPRERAEFRNRRIGFVFQDHCLLPQCSVLENVLVPTLVRQVPRQEREAIDKRAQDLIGRVGLSERMTHRPAELSGGEKQRVAIARALISEPKLVLCDEPTGNLDEVSADTVTALLLELHAQHKNIMITVTHSPRLANRFPTRFELAGGQLKRFND
jgi:lipoprotein-releasing system ATP-binding protein